MPVNRSGFSLLELLATIAIILILMALYWKATTGKRDESSKAACRRNLEKLYLALEIYANDHQGRFPAAPGARTSGEVLSLLVPRFSSDTSLFFCPGSGAADRPSSGSIRQRTIGYAYYMGRFLTNSQLVLVSDQQVDAAPKAAGQLVFSATGNPPGENHGQQGGNFLFGDGRTESSRFNASFPLPVNPGEALLNP